jgi:hypothetical protein
VGCQGSQLRLLLHLHGPGRQEHESQAPQEAGQCHKTFYGRNLQMFTIVTRVIVPENPLLLGLMFASKAGANQSEAHFRCSTLG